MKELLELILQNITTHPDDVKVVETQENDRIVYTISVHPEDMGRVIGKSGKVIKAIRSLAHVVAIRKNQHYRINVAEVDDGSEDAEEVLDAPVAEEATEEATQEVEAPATSDPVPAPDVPVEATPVEPVKKEEAADLISDTLISDTIDVQPQEPVVEAEAKKE